MKPIKIPDLVDAMLEYWFAHLHSGDVVTSAEPKKIGIRRRYFRAKCRQLKWKEIGRQDNGCIGFVVP